MKKPSGASSKRTGKPGLDIFKIAGQSISGYIPGLKTGNKREIRCPYTSLPEQMLALYLEYHPHVSFYQRGDASEAFAEAYHLTTSLGCLTRSTTFTMVPGTSIYQLRDTLSLHEFKRR